MNDIFAIWPDLGAFAAEMGVPYSTVASWRRRGIPERRVPEVVGIVRRRLSEFEREEQERIAGAVQAARAALDRIEGRAA